MGKQNKNVLVLTTWSFKDGLTQAAVLPYLQIISEITGGQIYLVCLEQKNLQLTSSEAAEAQRNLAKARIKLILFSYQKNKLLAAMGWIGRLVYLISLTYVKKVGYLHPFCAPAACMAWIVSRFKRVKLIADSFEPHAEMMAEMGIWNREGLLFRIMFHLEKKVVKKAYRLIAVSKNISTYIRDRYGLNPPLHRILHRPLCVNPFLFIRKEPDYTLIDWNRKSAKIIGIYTGKIGGMYYDEELCTFIKQCISFWQGDFHLILCTAMDRDYVREFFKAQGISQKFFTLKYVAHSQIPDYLSLADFGISFSRVSESRKYGCPTKNAEYWSVGLPVITTDAIIDDTANILHNPYLGVVMKNRADAAIQQDFASLVDLISRNSELRPLIRAFAVRERSFDTVRKVYEEAYR